MSDGYACCATHRAAIAQRKNSEVLRFEDDHQGGGSWARYTPGITVCWSCDEVIRNDGDCGRLCSTQPLRVLDARRQEDET